MAGAGVRATGLLRRIGAVGGVLLATMATAAPPAAGTPPRLDRSAIAAPAVGGDPVRHLAEILDRSPAPEYRRFGAPGMAASADYAADVLEAAGYTVLRHDRPGQAYRVDYRPGHEPLLVRTGDGRSFPVESGFRLEATTPPEGITCVVRAVEDVRAGDCGFVPFDQVSPEWNNFLGDTLGPVDTVIARGGVGIVLQGDVARGAVIAHQVRRPIPIVSAVATAGDLVGREVRLRARGGFEDAVLHNVVAVRPPTDPSQGYVLLHGHLDGWFDAAADNAAGSAAVLAAAERLVGDQGGRGLLVALYDGEENGLLGSRALAEDLARPEGLVLGDCGPVVRLHDVVAVVNLDASTARPSDVTDPVQDLTAQLGLPLDVEVPLFSWRVLVFSEEPVVGAALVTAMTAAGVLGVPLPVEVANPVNGGVARTDGRWFHEAGIPVAWPVAGYPEYHTSADTLATVDPVDLANLVTGAVSLVQSLDTLPVGRLSGSSLAAPGSGAGAVACPDQPPADGDAAAPADDAGAASGRLPATGASPWWPTAALALAGLAGTTAHLARRTTRA